MLHFGGVACRATGTGGTCMGAMERRRTTSTSRHWRTVALGGVLIGITIGTYSQSSWVRCVCPTCTFLLQGSYVCKRCSTSPRCNCAVPWSPVAAVAPHSNPLSRDSQTAGFKTHSTWSSETVSELHTLGHAPGRAQFLHTCRSPSLKTPRLPSTLYIPVAGLCISSSRCRCASVMSTGHSPAQASASSRPCAARCAL